MGQRLDDPDLGFPVAVVDDDVSVRDALALLLRMEGFTPHTFGDAETFVETVRRLAPSCIVLDLNLPGTSGLDVLRSLTALKISAPVIMMSGQSDIALAVEAMKKGALDFLEKPFVASAMIERIRDAVTAHRNACDAAIEGLASFSGRHRLTGRERDVLGLLAYGASNKEAGRRLGISPRTIEVHRARIMEKLGARNSADMMRIVLSESGDAVRTAFAERD
ncbi:MAG: DNA-binding response regulator [Proteobacteria bacterium SG_bin9]|nr:MAG: DNA-binding response regulator [Proteobacteria bacterium SG_bin9]